MITLKSTPGLSRPLLYNPLRMSPEDVEKFFIARREVFERILQEVVQTLPQDVPRHQLVIGQRGMGKTTMLTRVAVELRKQPHAQTWLPLSFWEEQHLEIDRLSDFWLNCLDSLADALDDAKELALAAKTDARVESVRQISDETERADAARQAFSEAIADSQRRPVLFIDNFNLLLARLKKHDYVLRGFFTRPGAPIIVGAGITPPSSFADYDAAFYDSFRTHQLNRLSLDEMESVLRELAKLDDRKDLLPTLLREKPRLAALRDLTGGNPRTTLLIYRLCANGFSEDAYHDLERLLDEITPLYQSRFDQISEQGQKLVVRLAKHWKPAQAKTIFEGLTGFPRGTIGPLVRQLERDGIVERVEMFDAKQRGISKKAGYQLAERFFNIWLLMRTASRRDRAGLACLVRFIESFFTPEQRHDEARRLSGKSNLSQGEALYGRAMAETLDGNCGQLSQSLRTQSELALVELTRGIQEKLADIIDPTVIQPKVFTFVELKQRLKALVPKGAKVMPEEFADLVLGSISMLATTPGRQGIAARSTLTISQVDGLADAINRELGTLIEMIGDEGVEFFRDQLLKCHLTNPRNAAEWQHVIPQTPNAKAATVAGDLAAEGGCYEEAEAAYKRACELDPKFAPPWNNLGNLLQDHLARYDEAEVAYKRACELDPKFHESWHNLGILLKNQLGRYEEAEAAYKRACELNPKSAYPWNSLGNLLRDHLGRYGEAEAAYKRACELDPKYAAPWNGRGNLYFDFLGRYEEAKAAYAKAIELNPTDDCGRHNFAFLLRDREHDFVGARKLISELQRPETWRDTQSLHEALFSAYEANWGLTTAALKRALAELGPEGLPAKSRDDWFRASAVLLNLGFGKQLLEFLRSEGVHLTLLPWFAALEAHVIGDKRELKNIPAEAQSVAGFVYDGIQKRRAMLPPPPNG